MPDPCSASGASPSRTRRILALGLPIVVGMISLNVLNLVDTAMVGTLGNTALAAVGVGSFANFIATAFVNGLSGGVQAIVSRRLGEGREHDLAVPLNGGLLLALAVSIPLMLGGVLLAPLVFPLMNPDPGVVAEGVPYLQVRLWGAAFAGLNFSFRGYWNGLERPGVYLRILLGTHLVNILLNWILIYGHLGAPALGSYGAGVGSTVATGLGTVLYLGHGWLKSRDRGFLRALPDRKSLRTMVELSVPAGLQQFMLGIGFTILFAIIGRISTVDTAAASVLVNISLVAMLPAVALGLAATTLVSQALGRGEPDDAYRWGIDVIRVALVVMFVLALPMVLAPELLLSGFLHEPAAIAIARTPLRLVGVSMLFEAIGVVLVHALIGAGATRQTLRVVVGMQWLVFIPAAWLAGPMLGYGILGIWTAMLAYRGIQAAIFVVLWRGRTWTRIHV